MPDEQLPRIEAKVDAVDAKVDRLEAKVDRLDEKVSRLDTRVDHVDEKVSRLETRVNHVDIKIDHLESSLAELRVGQGRIEKRLDKVEVTQEDLIDQIKLVAEGHAATQIMMKQGFDDLREQIGRRLEPLERTVHDHTLILRAHNLTLPADGR
jgi:chromosome segregation ATPase